MIWIPGLCRTKAAEAIAMVRARAHAATAPKTGVYNVLLSGEQRFSKELQKDKYFEGPFAVLLKNIKVAGR